MAKKPLIEKRLSNQQSEIVELKRLLSLQRVRLQMLEGMTRVSEKITSMHSLYDYYLGLILKITSTEAGSIMLVDDVNVGHQPRKGLVFAACKGKGSENLTGKRIPEGEGIAGYVAKTGNAYLSKDVKRDRRYSERFSSGIGRMTKNIICVPMKVSGKIIGVVEVLNKKDKKPLTKVDLALLKSLAAQVAVLIDNAHLLEKYKVKIKKLQVMEEVGMILNSTLNEKEIRRRAMEAATRLMDAETGSLLLIEHEKGELFCEAAPGKKTGVVSERRLKIGEGIAGWVAKTGRPVICNDVDYDPRYLKMADERSGFRTRNMICTPVRIKGKVIGVLQALNKKKGGLFTKWDLDEFNTLANQVAIAIDNANLYKEMKETFLSTAEALADTMEARDAYTGGHTKRVLEYSSLIGEELSLKEGEMENLKLAAVLHDIGKIGVEDRILRKDAKLTEEEDKAMRMHTIIGPRIVENIKPLRSIAPSIRHHHETYDGRGYPDLLKGKDIPIMARIISVADTFDAMTTDRPYRKGLPKEVALRELKDHAGIQFDAKVVDAFIRAFRGGKVQLKGNEA
jgi:HD-GYP domain-containing protein (c-di-GMP phosphodiesterase class II)